MQPLEVLLFGGFALRRGEDTVPPIASRVGRSLFGYLAMHRGVPLPRERLVSEFWPELSESRGRRRLSHTLWQLQDALGELPGDARYLDVGTDAIAFGTGDPVTVDVERFERGLEELRDLKTSGAVRARDLTRLERVVALYRGDLLDGHYEPWVREEQERLGQRYLEALATLVSMAKRLGAYDDALLYARRITHQDPLREDGHREVMRLSMLLGRPGEALRQFERCREVLAEELGTDPSPPTVELYERILRQGQADPTTAVTRTPFPERPPLVGRDRERAAALDVVDTAVAGRGGAVLVEGDPGLGKTRLLDEVTDDAGWRGFAVATAGCGGPGGGPFTLVRDLVEATLSPLRIEHLRHRVAPVWLVEVARLVPAVARAIPPERRRPVALDRDEGAQRMRDAVLHVLLALTDVDPLLLVVDDLQWADGDSLGVLAGLAAELPRHRCVLLLGYRGEEARARSDVWDLVQEVDRRRRPARILLRPLDVFSIGELTRSIAHGHRVDPAAASRLLQETGGNPLLVVETLRELADAGQLSALEQDAAALPLPSSIRELVLARADRLAPEARTVLDVVVVAGDRVDLDVLEAAVELPRSAVVTGVDLLVRRTLLRESGDAYVPHHEQIRRTCLDVIPEETVRSLHRRLADALEEHRPDEVERLAHHLEAAGQGRRAVHYLVAAGRRAAALHAYVTAEGFLRRAAEQQRRGPFALAERFALLQELEAVHDVLGERARQREVIDELSALAGGDPRYVAEVTRLSALLQAELGEPDQAIAVADRAATIAEELDDPALLARTVRAAASVRTWAGRATAALPLWERAIALGTEPRELAEARTMLASVLRELHRYDEAVAQLTEARVVAEEAGELREEARALGVLGSIRMETGDSAAAVELYRRSLERCSRIGFRRGERINLTNLGNVLYARGDVPGALDAYGRAATLAEALGDASGLAAVRMNLSIVRHTVLGHDEGARRDLVAALRYFRDIGEGRFEAVCHDALASIALRQGRLDAAAEHIAAGEAATAERDDAWVAVPLEERRAELALAQGDVDAAVGHAASAVELAETHGLRDLLPGVLTMLGRAYLQAGDTRRAEEVTARAVAGLDDGVERPYRVHLARHDALLAVGRTDEAHRAAAAGVASLTAVLDSLDPRDRERAATLAPHARLMSLAAAVTPRRMDVEVAARDAPRGRALRASERVEVHLELDPAEAPADPVDRRRWELARVVEQVDAQGGAVTVTDLAGILAVSEATVRRDLAALRAQGRAVPTRGARAG